MILRSLILLVISFVLASAAEPAAAPTYKFLCWNIHHGVGQDDQLDLARIAELIRKHDPDFVALQEIDNGCNRSGKSDQAAELGKLTDRHFAFGAAMPFDGGQYGQAILSKHPIRTTRIIRLPGTGEPRIALVAEITTPTGPLTWISTHLDHRQEINRLEQMKTLIEATQSITGPIAIAGDFNDVPDSEPLKLFTPPWLPVQKQAPAATSPSDQPKHEIDHIYLRHLTPAGPAQVIPEAIASDHRPIIGTFTLPIK